MTALKQEMIRYIENMPDSELEALRPAMLRLLAPAPDLLIIETDLNDKEKATVETGRAEWKANPQSFRRVV